MPSSINRGLALVSGAACCARLAAYVGLIILLWDQVQGLEFPSWLVEWSVTALAGSIAADEVVRDGRKHPAIGLVTMVVVIGAYFMCRHLWFERVAALGEPERSFGWGLGCIIAVLMSGTLFTTLLGDRFRAAAAARGES